MTTPTFTAPPAWGALRWNGLRAAILALCQLIPPGLLAGHALNKLLRGLIKHGRPQLVDTEVSGLRLRLLSRGNYSERRQLYEPQFFDCEEIDWLCARLAGGGTFLDIGANVGLYSLHVARRCGPGVRVLAVEPVPELAARMRFNAQTNGLAITAVACALSDRRGSAELKLGAQSGASSLGDGPAGARTLTVPLLPLLELLHEQAIGEVTALKIDVEGHEPQVLEPFLASAPRSLWPQAIVIEHTGDGSGLLTRLCAPGRYREVQRTRRNALLLRDDRAAPVGERL